MKKKIKRLITMAFPLFFVLSLLFFIIFIFFFLSFPWFFFLFPFFFYFFLFLLVFFFHFIFLLLLPILSCIFIYYFDLLLLILLPIMIIKSRNANGMHACNLILSNSNHLFLPIFKTEWSFKYVKKSPGCVTSQWCMKYMKYGQNMDGWLS